MKHLSPQGTPDTSAGTSCTALNGHLLLVSPLTFSYHEVICAQLRDMGYGVTWWNERARSATWYAASLRQLLGSNLSWCRSIEVAAIPTVRSVEPKMTGHKIQTVLRIHASTRPRCGTVRAPHLPAYPLDSRP